MTQDQAAELLAAIHDLQQIGMAIGMLLALAVVWLYAQGLMMAAQIFLSAMRRS